MYTTVHLAIKTAFTVLLYHLQDASVQVCELLLLDEFGERGGPVGRVAEDVDHRVDDGRHPVEDIGRDVSLHIGIVIQQLILV